MAKSLLEEQEEKAGEKVKQELVPSSAKASAQPDSLKLFYNIQPENWHKTFPFYFDIMKGGSVVVRFFLPIPPQSLTVQAMSTSEAHATIGGVVEETSAPVFWTVTLAGTTGLSSNDPGLNGWQDNQLSPRFRQVFDELTGLTNPFARLIGGALDGALSAFDAENLLPYASAGSAVNTPPKGAQMVSALAEAGAADNTAKENPFDKITKHLGKTFAPPKAGSPTVFSNGFSWSHGLQQLFLIYQRAKSQDPSYELYFVNVKANTGHRCVARSVQFQQNDQTPYISSYVIVLKCWDLQDAAYTANSRSEVDRFKGDLKEVYTASFTSAVSKIGNVMRKFNRKSDVAGALVKNSIGSIL